MQKIRVGRAARRLSAVGNRLLEWRDQRRRSGRQEEIVQHEGACGEEFSRLAIQVQRENEIGVARTAEYLNWRFLAHPTQRFEVLTARRNAKLAGYLIFTQAAEDARIVDLTAIPDTELLSALIVEAVLLLRRRGVMTLSASVLASHRYLAVFQGLGFHSRDSCPVVFHTPATMIPTSPQGKAMGWFLMDGDRDS